MLNFLKKLFAKEEIKEEKIELNELGNWLDEKTKPLFESLDNNISQIISKIDDEREKGTGNLKILENAKLQNPKIPERVKTIMEGNRAAFIKKAGFFFDNLDLKYHDYNGALERCNEIKNQIDSLGKSTARSYQVLNEFFAREAENIAINIKNTENYSNEIKNSIKNDKILNIKKIKNAVVEIQNKIKLKENLANSLKNEKNNYENSRSKETELKNKINRLKSGGDYKIYEQLLEDKNKLESQINDVENQLFHDFSVLEKALKKYAKIAFENENLILQYLSIPIKALAADSNLEIIKILNNLEKSIDELGLDAKKSEKTLSKIKELNSGYFRNLQNKYNNLKQKLDERKMLIENNKPKKELDSLNTQLNNIDKNIENLNSNISTLKGELEKINIEKLKENLQEEVNDVLNARITVH